MSSNHLENAVSRVRKRLMENPNENLIRGTYPISESALEENKTMILAVEKAQALCENCDGIHCKQRSEGMRPALRFDGDMVSEVVSVCPKAVKKKKAMAAISNIPKRYLGKNFSDIKENSGNREAIKALQWCLKNPEAEKNGLYIYGSTGLGKTLMGVAFAQEQANKGVETMFISAVDLIAKIKQSFDNPESFRLEDVLNVPCLVLDDLGAGQCTDWMASKLYELLNYRYTYMLQTVITSNYSLKQLQRHLSILPSKGVIKRDENIGMQIISRIVGMCFRVRIDGIDQRFLQKEGAC